MKTKKLYGRASLHKLPEGARVTILGMRGELGQDVQLIVFVQVTAQGFFQAVPGDVKIRFQSLLGIEPQVLRGSDLANFSAIACCRKKPTPSLLRKCCEARGNSEECLYLALN